MAPELLLEPLSYDPYRADVWSLGVTLLALHTTRQIFARPSVSGCRVFARVAACGDVRPLLDVEDDPEWLRAACLGTVVVDPAARTTARALEEAMEEESCAPAKKMRA